MTSWATSGLGGQTPEGVVEMETREESVGGLLTQIAMLEERVAQLQHALDSRIVIEQAKGAVAARCGVSPDDGFQMLRALARSQRRNLHEYCAEIVANGGRLDGAHASTGPLALHT
jgi:hypothetical protein